MQIEELRDFRNFAFLVHHYIGLPEPTPLQNEMALSLEDSPERYCLQAFRGCGKSHLSALYALWCLYWDPEEKILVVSATGKRAAEFVKFCKETILVCPFLEHMKPGTTQRDLAYSFDVHGCLPSQTPSLEAKGITSQITGSRATKIIGDDIEIATTVSVEAREKLENLSFEFESILLPGGKIIYLGTPHSSSSMYNGLPNKGYEIQKFPIYNAKGENVEPGRFSEKDLNKRRKAVGESVFRLQFLLDTSLTDKDKFPLHVNDLVITEDYDDFKCKEDYKRIDAEVPYFIKEKKGLDKPYFGLSSGYEVGYTKKILALDPAGSGTDEFAWHVLATRNSFVFVLESGAWDSFDKERVDDIKEVAMRHKVNEIVVETNFGDSILIALLQPNIPIPITPVKVTTQKERRIISILEPILNQRKLIVNQNFIKNEKMMAQFCNLTAEKGSLKHDDRIDCLALGVNHLQEEIMINVGLAKEKEYLERLEAEIADLQGSEITHSWI
jgi:hypothetical protein